jgi:hypothetical protein
MTLSAHHRNQLPSQDNLIEDKEATGMKAPYDGPQGWTIEQHLRVAAAEGLATIQVSSPAARRPPTPLRDTVRKIIARLHR